MWWWRSKPRTELNYEYNDINPEADIYVSSKEVVTLADYNTMNDLIKIFAVKKSHLTEDLEDLSKMMNMFHSSNRDVEAVFKSTNIV